MMFQNVKTIFFDYDGTLHDSIKIYAPAFKKAYEYLAAEGHVEERVWEEKEISHWLGFTRKEMWEKFMPELDEEIKDRCSSIIGKEMKKQMADGNSVLYDGTIETLKYLKDKGYRLVFLSNCGIEYRNSVNELFQLDQYFEALVCAEDYDYIPKYEILGKIMDKYPQEMIMVGDRMKDIEAGVKNNIYTVGCSYGFGEKEELVESDIIINDIKELTKYL